MTGTNAPQVTAVVPTRDRPVLLRAALDAILGQDYAGAIDVVVVYDQSEPDLTLAEDPRIRVITNSRTPGLAGARNTGILAATGELVAFCDDDDEWLPGKLAAQVAALRAAPDGAFVSCGIRVDYDGRSVDRSLPMDRVPLAALLRDRHTELHPSTFLIRRGALVDGIGLVDEEIPGSYAEDYEFLLRAARHAPLVNLAEPYVTVRWHKRSYFAQRWETISTALQWLLSRYPEFASVPAGEARVAGQIAFAQAAMGNRREAVRWARRTLVGNPREPRAYLALAVASKAVHPDRVLRTLHKRGRGI
ncbi:Glycosyltransferase, GT2 family [Micromonospora rhizosphaerae]|uniref:Glycosyltransferase, GT2 family n=1 Tax=Micromonospora rhizosphaerae TaxID=568872 RepID=A0A1C6RE43_9ACTN|nr:glycosyltransferase family 2 protein [Micromonospora rhizosphaerae]SCL15410.1 Glycosyltransferase, GT2 family [Micromonospora rhizosphaerae]